MSEPFARSTRILSDGMECGVFPPIYSVVLSLIALLFQGE
jgi:hypothetical protein